MSKNSLKIRKVFEALAKSTVEIQNQKNMRKVLEEALVIVVRRTRLGFSVAKNGGNRRRLKPLSKSYIEQRQGKLAFFTNKKGTVVPIKNPKKKLRLSDRTTPSKSNLTLTNQLLESLKTFNKGRGQGEIRPTGIRKDGFTNEEIAEFVSEARPFLNLSNNEIKQLEFFIRELLTDLAKRNIARLR